ncbi:MAG: hypothetical protein J0M12_02745 [Deltaproteobacteria bacterium]|nr:hypothetical protein [Deltaproteobacteria bacterium]
MPQQRDSALQYEKLVEHSARLEIHPGYLAELANEPVLPNSRLSTNNFNALGPRAPENAAMHYISFGAAFIGLIVSLSTAFLYCGRMPTFVKHTVSAPSPMTHPDLLRLDESVRRLSIALAAVISSMQEHSNPSTIEQAKTVEVVVQKANLRIAPDTRSSAVMAIAHGSRLLVESERNGWLRVFAPSGEVLWIQKALTSEYSN